jgi:cytochrome c-type biogenesis protein CcmE
MTASIKFLIGSIALTGAVAYLIYAGVQQSGVYYFKIDEFLAQQAAYRGEAVRVAGRVTVGSVTKKMTPTGEELKFQIGDFVSEGEAKETVKVHFVGVTPDMFKAEGGSDVIVEGKFDGAVIHAQSVMTSCPSKYEAEAQQEAGGGVSSGG